MNGKTNVTRHDRRLDVRNAGCTSIDGFGFVAGHSMCGYWSLRPETTSTFCQPSPRRALSLYMKGSSRLPLAAHPPADRSASDSDGRLSGADFLVGHKFIVPLSAAEK